LQVRIIFGSEIHLRLLTSVSPDLTLYTQQFWRYFMSIYVGNLSYEVTPEDLKQAFGEYGTVNRVQLPTDRETGRMRGFAFVEMGTEAEESAAIEALDGAEWMGRDLKVNKAKPREDRSSGGGGNWGGNNRGGGNRRY
jgi:RNA recognition motif-containing protein